MESQLRHLFKKPRQVPGNQRAKKVVVPLPSPEDFRLSGDLLPSGEVQEALPFKLEGSARKTAYCIRHNAENMCREAGIEAVGFLTLTVGDWVQEPDLLAPGGKRERFQQVFDAAEASRRINNLNRRFLPEIFEKAIVVTERCKNRAIHFHVIGILKGRTDIRTGFNWSEVENRNYSSACLALRGDTSLGHAADGLWKKMRNRLPGMGFGRAELLPVKKSGEAIASYVAKYIEKTLFNRQPDDYRKKLVRYMGWRREVDYTLDFTGKPMDSVTLDAAKLAGRKSVRGVATQLRPNDFSWGTPGSVAWRCALAQMSEKSGLTRENIKEKCGSRWAYRIHKQLSACLTEVRPHFADKVKEKIEEKNLTVRQTWTTRVLGMDVAAYKWISERPLNYWIPDKESDTELYRTRRENNFEREKWSNLAAAIEELSALPWN